MKTKRTFHSIVCLFYHINPVLSFPFLPYFQLPGLCKSLDDIYRETQRGEASYTGGTMLWPTPGNNTVALPYGWFTSGKNYHSGVDITGEDCYGDDIVAASGGTVRYVEKKYPAGEGLGLYLIIDHGGDISTLYAQCSTILVEVGDVVEQGQKIAEIGSTGFATGPHLHFEVRLNGMHVDPLDYFPQEITESSSAS